MGNEGGVGVGGGREGTQELDWMQGDEGLNHWVHRSLLLFRSRFQPRGD